MCGNDTQTKLILELGSKFQRLGPESGSKQLSLGRKTTVPTVGAPDYHLASGGKGQQDLSVHTTIMWEQLLEILSVLSQEPEHITALLLLMSQVPEHTIVLFLLMTQAPEYTQPCSF